VLIDRRLLDVSPPRPVVARIDRHECASLSGSLAQMQTELRRKDEGWPCANNGAC
jgi:hypothetical protein